MIQSCGATVDFTIELWYGRAHAYTIVLTMSTA